MGKGGQITYFIIVGLVMLFGVVLFFMSKEQEVKTLLLEDTNTQVPIEFQPVKNFVTSCLERVSKDALIRLGKQGGYVQPQRYGYTAQDEIATERRALDDGAGNTVPYWYHLVSSNSCAGDCKFASEQPPLENQDKSMQSQLHEYILLNMPFCLNQFKSLEAFSIQQAPLELLGQITEDDVRFKLLMPIQATIDGKTTTLDAFFVKHDLDLRRIVSLAQALTVAEQRYQYLERSTLNTIGIFSGIDKVRLPPQEQVTFDPKDLVYWTKQETKERVKDLLVSHTSLFQVPDTSNFVDRRAGNPYVAGLYGLYDLPVFSTTEDRINDITVDFRYQNWWQPYFRLSGRGVSGELIGPEQGFMEVFSFMAFRRYANYYDISHPVLVQLHDTSAFGKEGYSFQFALESNLRRNAPLNSSYVPLGEVDAGIPSLLCEANQRNSGNVTIALRDGKTQRPMEAFVQYACGEEMCAIGQAKGTLVTQLPVCSGGRIVIQAPDYEQKIVSLNTELRKDAAIEIEVEPYREVTLKVFKRRYSKGPAEWFYDPNPAPLLDNEVAIVTLKRLDAPHDASLVVRGAESAKIRLLPGKYSVEGSLLFELPAYGLNEIIIPARKIMSGPPWDQQEIELPAIEFESTFLEGGVVLDTTEIKEDKLDASTQLNVFVIAPIASNSFNRLEHDDLGRMDMVEELSKTHKSDLVPILS